MEEQSMGVKQVLFEFDDRDLVEIGQLQAEGFKFATVTVRNEDGREREFMITAERTHDYTSPRCWCGEANYPKATHSGDEKHG
jgi:hypothetical protein